MSPDEWESCYNKVFTKYEQAQAEIEKLKNLNEIMREALLRIQVRVDEGGYEYSQGAISEIVKYGLTKES